MRRILVAGAGYVGASLGRLLAARGDEVIAVSRSLAGLGPDLHPFAADLLDAKALARIEGRFDAVVFTAGPSETSAEAYRRTYLEGLASVLDAFADRAGRVLFTSSTAVYAQSDGSWVDESSPAEASHFSGATLVEAEALLSRSHPTSVALRLGGIYGPGRAGLIESVRRGDATYSPLDEKWVNRIHRDDCARALAHLIELEHPERVYLGVDSEPASRREVLEFISLTLGVPAPTPRAPRAESPRRGGSHKRCSNARLLRSGFSLIHPSYREGYAAVLSALAGSPRA